MPTSHLIVTVKPQIDSEMTDSRLFGDNISPFTLFINYTTQALADLKYM